MAVRRVLVMPHSTLGRVARPIGRVDDAARALAQDLIDTMRASPACVGLAAPQIGESVRAFVVDVTGHRKARSCHGEFVLFDPRIVSRSDSEVAREGCMSVPDLTGEVARATRLSVAGIGIDGEPCSLEVDAFEARAVQHEMDHLDGLLLIDRVAGPHALFERRVYR